VPRLADQASGVPAFSRGRLQAALVSLIFESARSTERQKG
jgi:hypothetical protein